MISEWFQRVGSSVPRGFSRYYILELLRDKHRTGKEIIDHATQQSNGMWRPSPGLIYPLLGRMLDDGLVEDAGDGRYKLTRKGEETAEDVSRIGDVVRRQIDVLFRLGNAGRFVAMDLLERIVMMGSMLSSNAANITDEEAERYREFLESELERMNKKPKEIRVE